MSTSRKWASAALLLAAATVTSACGNEVLVPDGSGGDSGALLCGPEPEPSSCGPYTCESGTWQKPCCGPPDCCGPQPASAAPECSTWCNDGGWFATCECPEKPPPEGSACPDPGLPQFDCSFQNDACGSYVSAACEQGTWHLDYQPMFCCPAAAPVAGAGCAIDEVICEYRSCAGRLLASCTSGSWSVAVAEPPLPCAEASTEVDCKGIAGCRYFTPGCEDAPGGPPGVTGCFTQLPCDFSDAPTPTTCAEVNVTPVGEGCSYLTTVCLP